MKKSIGSVIVTLLLIGFALLQMRFSVNAAPSNGKKPEMTEQYTPSSGSGIVADLKATSEYALPYPGILQDHPLYFLKRIRDAILDKLIVDPVRKTEFTLLQSDKHLNMAILLQDQGKTTYVATAVRTSDEYMKKTVGRLVQLKESNKPAPEYLRDRVEKSLLKHAQVLTEISLKAEGDTQQTVNSALDNSKQYREQVISLK